VSQALSWLAKERRELQEQLDRERQIAPLIQRLIAIELIRVETITEFCLSFLGESN
jgi:hypothetical protein